MQANAVKLAYDQDVIDEVAEVRYRLDLVLNEGAKQLTIMRSRCDELRETVSSLHISHAHLRSQTLARSRLAVLSERELDVLKAIAEGKSTKQLAFELNITFKTAVSHRTRLMHKLGVHETASLVKIAISAGLVSL
jgi:DNA-binding NarL/FixJ family response regulator